jgi:hypothetical protein
MTEDEAELLLRRIQKKEDLVKEAKKSGDKKTVKDLSMRIALLEWEVIYVDSGGNSLNAPDDISQIEFMITNKKTSLEGFKRNIKLLPNDDIDLAKYTKIIETLTAQIEYLSAKRKVIIENRHLKELAKYIKIAESEGVRIIASPLEHQADVSRFKPVKREKRKKGFTIDTSKISIYVIIFFLLLSVYIGTSWRKTPYDRAIIRNYVVARNHYIEGNNNYVTGDYENSMKEYAIAATFFSKASADATLASNSNKGKMSIYFNNKRRFFKQWEDISIKMVESSKEFESGDPNVAAAYAEEVVWMAEIAETYNNLADEAWGLI